jgi:hypothetical protein
LRSSPEGVSIRDRQKGSSVTHCRYGLQATP